MAGSCIFDNLGGISFGPADLFGLMAFNLRRTESSQTIISVTEGTEQSVRSLCCAGKSVTGSFVSQASFFRETSGWFAKYRLFSEARFSQVEHQCNELLRDWKRNCRYNRGTLYHIPYISLKVGKENYLLFLGVCYMEARYIQNLFVTARDTKQKKLVAVVIIIIYYLLGAK